MNINEFKGSFDNLARPTLFKVYGLGADRNLEFHCKAAQLPANTLGVIEVPYLGRKIKIPGDRTYVEWTITILNDVNFTIRNYFEQWSESINGPESNLGFNNAENVKQDGFVDQLGLDGSVLATYRLVGCWPSEVGAVDLAWDSNDTVEEYPVTLQYDYFLRDK